jgi:NRPS condensation-like uncharacterized protein
VKVGEGGIGILLRQTINQLNHRVKRFQMLAISIVVANMDYIVSILDGKLTRQLPSLNKKSLDEKFKTLSVGLSPGYGIVD